MGIEQYVDIYYISNNKIKVGSFYAERVGKVIRVNGLNIVFNSNEEAKNIFETIKNTIKNLSLDSSVILFQSKYVLIALPLSAIWEYNWVYSTDSALVFPSESEAEIFFLSLKEKISSLKVRDVIGVVGGTATSQVVESTGNITVKRVELNILEDSTIKYIPFLKANQIQVFKVEDGQIEPVTYSISELNPLLSKYVVVIQDGSVAEQNTDILETSPIDGESDLYEATIDLTKYEDITQIYVAI